METRFDFRYIYKLTINNNQYAHAGIQTVKEVYPVVQFCFGQLNLSL